MAHHRSSSNGLGVAGFVTSLVGLVLCGGLICPIGLFLSFVALFRRPRGFAVAGFIIGLIGSAWLIVAFLFVFVLGVGLAGVAALGMKGIEAGIDANEIRQGVTQYHSQTGALPSSLALLSLDPETLVDPWGTPYRYEIDADGRRFSISTAGPDGVWDTEDDFSFDQDALAP